MPPAEGSGSEHTDSVSRRLGRAVTSGAESAAFFASLLSGFLLGFFADRWLGTGPGLTIFGIFAGAGTGFWRMWQYAARLDDPRR
ncbi:MAG: AtpZ/AtpI family protein [Actinobacteria bacterium]|nr:AtpZ/AtpI family protein [Actinomycetota bacterium]